MIVPSSQPEPFNSYGTPTQSRQLLLPNLLDSTRPIYGPNQRLKRKPKGEANDRLEAESPLIVPRKAHSDYLVLKDLVSRELCCKCEAFNVKGKPWLWIFCITCGESFHQNCADDAPIPEHPILGHLPPNCYEAWPWQCRGCRICSKCNRQDSLSLKCVECHQNYCMGCDSTDEYLPNGYYFRCSPCRATTTRKCLDCMKQPLKSRRQRSFFCHDCARLGACPRCNRRYGNTDYSPMIACDSCNLWTHAICAGLSPAEYTAMQEVDRRFFCFRCEATWEFNHDEASGLAKDCVVCCDGLAESFLVPWRKAINHTTCYTKFAHPKCISRNMKAPYSSIVPINKPADNGFWLRRGTLSFRVIKHQEQISSIEIVKQFWSPKKPLQRVPVSWIATFDSCGRSHGISVSVPGESANITREGLSFPDAINWFISLYDNAARNKYYLDSLKIDAFFTSELAFCLRTFCTPCPSLAKIKRPKEKVGTLAVLKTSPPLSSSLVITTETPKTKELPNGFGDANTCARIRKYQKVFVKPLPVVDPERLAADIKRIRLVEQINAKRQSSNPLVVRRSRIAGLGLFTTRPIPAQSRVIEYCGELVGQLMADRREMVYSRLPLRRNDCYLFRVSEDVIIDATMKANMARFINHSCDPNCESRVEHGRRKIMIYALRDIVTGEELAYDYKFSREPGEDPVPCFCGAENCRKYMNL